MVNWGKFLGGAAGLAGFVPGGQAFAGVLGAVATAVASPEGVVYLSPYVDATIPAPFGFPSKPAALTLRPKPKLTAQLKGAVATPKPRPLFRLEGAQRAPFEPPPGKQNLAGLMRAHAPALIAHPQYLGGLFSKWTDAEGWVERVARLRAGIALDADGFDPSWAWWDDPPTFVEQVYAKALFPASLPSVEDFKPAQAHPGLPLALDVEAPENMLGIPYEKLADHVDRNLNRARELVKETEAALWEEIAAQSQFDKQVAELSEQYREHVQAALANGVPLLPWDQFIAGAQEARQIAPEVVTLSPRRQSATAAESPRSGGALILFVLAAAAAVL